jgi:sigma-E factor negative regulatory protein RseB
MTRAAAQRLLSLRNSRMPAPSRVARNLAAMCMLSAGLAATARAGDAVAEDARAWLERMSRALATSNYDGRFLHLVGGHAENMRIIHRVVEGGATERLVSLDGSGRELIRTDSEVLYYLPDRRQVLVEKRIDRNSLLATVPVYSEGLQSHYTLAAPGSTRILGRPAQFVVVQPRDNLRYGYKLWLDRETAMPLKSQLCDRSGRVIEQIVFSELSMPASIDPALVKSSIPTEGFQWIRQDARAMRAGSGPGWVVVNPPQGFRLTVTRLQSIVGASGPVRHLVLSDGLASVSVFIEPKGAGTADKPSVPELARVGTALAYSTETADHRITAVGEVPADTLRVIASSVQREAPAGAQTQ